MDNSEDTPLEPTEVIEPPKRKMHYPDEYVEDGKHYVNRDGEKLLVLRNGTLRGKHGFAKGGVNDNSITTTERGREMQQLLREKKRQVVMEAANEAVENRGWKVQHGDMAFIAAITNNAMMKAQTPEDPKAIEAARFVMKQAGVLEEEEEDKAVRNKSALEELGYEAVMQVLEKARSLREAGQ